MHVDHITPILNVADVPASLAWFERLGWERTFTWNDAGMIDGRADANDHGPADFAGVCAGDAVILLCRDGQGSRGRHGAWMSWWVPTPADVDAVAEVARAAGAELTQAPTDEPWGCRECHLRHPDGHVFRVSAVTD